MGKIRKSIVKTMVLVLITIFFFPMLNFSLPVRAAETYQYITQWGSYGSGNGQFNEPLGVAVDSLGNVYVADWGANNRIDKFTSNGVFITSWGGTGSGNGQLSNPGQVAVDSSGNVYVADAANNRVQKFTSDGAFITSLGGFFNPIGVSVDSSGNVYVLDSYNSRVVKFTSSGVYITSWGTSSAGWCDAVDSSGNVYVVEPYINLVQKFTSAGVLITSWGGTGSGNGQFNNPTGIAVDSQGSVYVTDTFNNLVQKFTSSGVFITQWSISGYGWGVAVDSSGNVYVTDYSHNCVQVFSTHGTPTPPNPAPSVAWSQTYSEVGQNGVNTMIQTADGGYALAGSTDWSNSSGGIYQNITTVFRNAFLIKTDSNGNMLWNRTYPGDLSYTEPFSLVKTSDGGYLIACGTTSDYSNISYRLIKTNASGNMLWNKTFAVTGYDMSGSAIQTTDGGYALIGTIYQLGYSNAYLIKTDSNGNMLWDKTYGGLYFNHADSIVQNSDSGYTITGVTSPSGTNEAWLFKTDLNGNILWSKTYGNDADSSSNRLIVTSDGGYAFAGTTRSFYSMFGVLWKTDANGNEQWNHTYVGINYFEVFSLSQTHDGGYALLGSPGGNVTIMQGSPLVRTDSSGTILWNQTYSQYPAWIYAMILTNDGGYAFAGTLADSYGYYGSFLMKTNPEQVASAKPVLKIGSLVVGNPASSDWNCKVTDSATGTVISQFTLPAAGTSGSYTNTVELSSAGSYVVFEEPKFGYHTSTQINGSVIDSFQSTVNVNAGDNLQVLFTNTVLPSGSLELPPPSNMRFSIPPLALVPIQAAWNPEANHDGRLDLVVNKPMAILINFTVPVSSTDQVTVSMKFDQETYNKTVYGAILNAYPVISFSPITPRTLGFKELNGTYQINSGLPIAFPSSTLLAVKNTTVLPLYCGYFTRSDYGTLSKTSYTQMATDTTNFINATYPVKNIAVNLNYNSVSGNQSVPNQQGLRNDLKYMAYIAKTTNGEYTNSIAIAIEPASYFTYHGLDPSSCGGVSWGPGVKGVVVQDGSYTEGAHEVAHATYGLFYPLEYYAPIRNLQGTIVSGVYAEKSQWRTGLDIMDYSSLSGNNWVSKITYDNLFGNTTQNFPDPEILVASGTIYKNGTVELAGWAEVAQGIPDSMVPGNYSLQFLAANGTVLGSTSFGVSFVVSISPGVTFETDSAPFCFATTYPKGTAEVKVLSVNDQSVPPKVLTTVQEEDILKINNGITFTETGLPAGESWSVTLGSRTLFSTTSTISFTGLASGTYDWTVSTPISGGPGVRYAPSVSTGTVEILGNISKSIPYLTQYQVSFGVSPTGAGNTDPDNTNFYNTGSKVSISATAAGVGQYKFLSWSSSSPSIVFSNDVLASTSITVNGPGAVTATFSSIVGDSIAFTETGLPSGKSWSVTLGGQTLSSTSGAIVFTNLASGSYSWSASNLISGSTGVTYVASTSSGIVNVVGQSSKSVTYLPQYQVSFAVNTIGAGTVNPTPTTYYNAGSKVSILATPKSGYNFWSWTATPTSAIYFQSNSSTSTTATINEPGTITANFAYVVTGNRNLVFTGTNNLILVTGGNNIIDCRKATATTIIKTGTGNNVIYLGEGDNVVKETASGNDIITSGNGNNNIDIIGKGNYQVTTGSGNDVIRVTGDGNCIIKAGDGDNQVTVLGKGNNQITAGFGNNVIVAGDGNNIVKTGDGNNKVTLGNGNNQVTTGIGADIVTVGNGNNNIQTGSGDDNITVGSGNNYVDGGAGYDVCLQGKGRNTILNCEKK